MCVLWYDGFDEYGIGPGAVAPMQSLYSDMSAPPTLTQARTGTISSAFNPIGQLRRSLNGDFTTVGCALGLYMENLPNVPPPGPFKVVDFCSVENYVHVSIVIGSTGRLMAYKSGNVGFSLGAPIELGSSEIEMAPGRWNHIEAWVHFDETAGTVKVYLNGVLILNLGSLDTLSDAGVPTASPTCSQLRFGNYANADNFPPGNSFIGNWYFDDIVAMNDSNVALDGSTSPVTGATNLGQYGVYYEPVNADTSDAMWQKSAGTVGFSLLNESPPDNDVTFIFSPNVNDISRFGVAPLPANVVAVAAVMNLAYARKTDTGDCDIQLGVKSSSTTKMSGNNDPLTTNYGYNSSVFEQDPSTSGAWSPTALPSVIVKRTL